MAKGNLSAPLISFHTVNQMKSLISTLSLLSLLFFTSQIAGCSGDEETAQEDSTIDRAVQKVADRGVEYIQTPIDKARAVKDIEEARREQLEEQNP